jgi:hypothetical protein
MGQMFGWKRKAKLLGESFTAGITNTGNVSATVNGNLVLSWHDPERRRPKNVSDNPATDDARGIARGFADATIANIHDAGMSQDDMGRNIRSIAMLWRLFTTPVGHDDPGFTYGDLVAVKNFHVAFELHEQPNDQFKVTWTISTTPGR